MGAIALAKALESNTALTSLNFSRMPPSAQEVFTPKEVGAIGICLGTLSDRSYHPLPQSCQGVQRTNVVLCFSL